MSEEEGLQYLLDKYGYVIMGTLLPCKPGDVIHGVNLGANKKYLRRRSDISVIVVGFATIEEWQSQRNEIRAPGYGEPGYFNEEQARRFKRIIKVRAE